LKEIFPTWLKQRWPTSLSRLNKIHPPWHWKTLSILNEIMWIGQWNTCLQLHVQPAIAEGELRDKLKAVAWASEIREKKPAKNGTLKVFYIYLPKGVTDGIFNEFHRDLSNGSLTGNTLSGLNQELQEVLSHQIMETAKILEVRHVPSVGGLGLVMELFFIGLDVITDLLQIGSLYMDEFYWMGGVLLSVFVSSLTAQLFSGELCKLPREFNDSLHKGIKTDGFLRIGDREKGFEGFMSLAISCYIVYWQVSALSCITSVVSIILSGRGVAGYLFQTVFLEHAANFL